MIDNLSELEQMELFKQWWKHYGKIIVVIVILGLLAGLAWYYWHDYQQRMLVQASDTYKQLETAYATHDNKQVKIVANQLMKHYSNTPYAELSALMLAYLAVTQQHFKQAIASLHWVIQHGHISSLKQIARLRVARILLARKEFKKALHILVTVDEKTYQPLIDMQKGDIYLAMGNKESAKKFYQLADIGFVSAGVNHPYLKIKMQDL